MEDKTNAPALIVEKEPDYWSRGHFYEGVKSWINPSAVQTLPIGTELYTSNPDPLPHMSEMNRKIAYSSAAKLRELGYEWNGEEWVK